MGRNFSFTEATIKALKPPEGGREYHKDRTFPGLQVCVTATGSKTYYFVKRVAGKPKRLWLGTVDQLSVANARKAAAKQASKIADGADPQSERQARRKEPTLAKLWASYLELHAKRQKKTWKEDQRHTEVHGRSTRQTPVGNHAERSRQVARHDCHGERPDYGQPMQGPAVCHVQQGIGHRGLHRREPMQGS